MADVKGKSSGSRKTVDKWKKKKWFTINASKTFNKKALGEIPGEKNHHISGRVMGVTLDVLTGQRAKRDTKVTFKVNDVQGQNANTMLIKFEMNRGSLGRMIRRRASKISVVEKVPIQKGDARITLVAITSNKATAKQKTGVRKIMIDALKDLRGKDFEDVAKELLFGNITNDIFKNSKKICLMKKVLPAKAKFIEAK
jgi:small subunit ribosomal protein S3Ae